jgi:hypothetical protein
MYQLMDGHLLLGFSMKAMVLLSLVGASGALQSCATSHFRFTPGFLIINHNAYVEAPNWFSLAAVQQNGLKMLCGLGGI